MRAWPFSRKISRTIFSPAKLALPLCVPLFCVIALLVYIYVLFFFVWCRFCKYIFLEFVLLHVGMWIYFGFFNITLSFFVVCFLNGYHRELVYCIRKHCNALKGHIRSNAL